LQIYHSKTNFQKVHILGKDGQKALKDLEKEIGIFFKDYEFSS
jgi:hypothetical protein